MKEKNKIDRMHSEYNSIPIPAELKQRVEQEMKKAKEEKNMNTPKNNMIRIVRRTAAGAAAAMLVITVLTNSNYSIAHAMEQIPVIGSISKVVTFRTYEKEKGDMTATVDVPQVSVNNAENIPLSEASDLLNKSVEEYTNEIIAMFEKDIEATDGKGKEDLQTSYQIVTDNDTLFSLRINTVVAMGGSNSFTKIYHINKKTGKQIELNDLFKKDSDYVSVLNETLVTMMREQMKEDESISYFIDTEMGDLDFQSIKEDQNFYINENGKLVLVFDKYEIAPGYMGMVEMVIPTNSVEAIVEDEYLQ